ncbi:MAG: nucleotide sugar dehydrogenase [Actinomycetota bacterium]|nr:MAG: nucleotide sugar dehydrogenase [Actinomycetota bacterium]
MLDVVVVGGGGHVGLPLALAFADRGLRTVSYDINADTVARVSAGQMPFSEDGAEPVLARVLADNRFSITADPSVIADADTVVVVVGTPVDEHLNPDPDAVIAAVRQLVPSLRPNQLLVLRSTVYPGVTRQVIKFLDEEVPGIQVAFCPERIAQGRAMTELFTLPQIVGSDDDATAERAGALFKVLSPSIVVTSPEEAELAKLFTNVWRYVKFAAANQFYMMANDVGVDFDRVRQALAQDYPRASDMPGAGFAAGPCLLKDTLQLAAFEDNRFALGHAAMMVNEGLPLYLVKRLERMVDLRSTTVGILGMSFKPGTDDPRASLSYKLRKILAFRAAAVLCTDPLVDDDRLVPLERVLAESDVLIIGTPHEEYRDLAVSVPVVDVWNLRGEGVRV